MANLNEQLPELKSKYLALMKNYKYPSVLTIAGFDGSGGAGIQADIKTISALGCYATSALTALPVQNTTGVRSIYPIATKAVEEQIDTILSDIFPDAIKIGMVHTSELVGTIADSLSAYDKNPIIFDPVMVASSGHRLIEESTIHDIVEKLFPISSLITPNMDEAAILAQCEVKTLDDMHKAAERILKLGCKAILLKGGHLDSSEITSLYLSQQGELETYQFEKFSTNNTHGSGCSLSSAIASFCAQGKTITEAIRLGQEYVHHAIYHGRDVQIGKGNGPLNHFFNPQKLIKHDLV